MASEYFLEPEINLVTENTENILSEGEHGRDPGNKRVWEEGAGLGREREGSHKGQRVEGRRQSGRREVKWKCLGQDEHQKVCQECGLVEGPVNRGPS